MKVSDPTGQVWRVSRRWVPWRRRFKKWLPQVLGWLGADDPLSILLVVLVGIPFAVAALVELAVMLLVLPFAVLHRAAVRRRWTVEARKGLRIWWDDDGGDWSASAARIRAVAADVERGVLPPQTVDAPAPTP
ncbi:hypothetical protein [Nocardioides sp. 1609]|uniref:hypothetical protein n=1 Tax=Nocardioides sp. 1609 TaxID=2508327 RepID=UPI00107014F2|nr:hypothetical protein [Nocardioides sp. 1609]